MLWRYSAALFSIAMAWGACTERVMLKETPEFLAAQDAQGRPPSHPLWDASDGNHKLGECKLIDEPKAFHRNSAEVMILLDRSSAMQQNLGTSTRLAVIQESLRTAIDTYQTAIRFGFIEYPGPSSQTDCGDKSCCANKVQVETRLNNLGKMEDWIRCEASSYPCPKQTTDTPLHLGLASISSNLRTGDSFDLSQNQWNASDHSRLIFLFAAADANCAGKNSICDDALAQVQALKFLDIGLITFTLGWVPPANSCIAKVIQTSGSSNLFKKAYVIEKESELPTLLELLLNTLSRESCELKLEETVNRPGQLIITFNDTEIARDPVNGWAISQRSTSIQFFGRACDTLRNSRSMEIKIIDKCSTCLGLEACRPGTEKK